MSIVLEDAAERSLQVNAWNWGVLHHVVQSATPPLLDDDTLEALRFGGGLELSQEEIVALYVILEKLALPLLQPGQRMFFDFSVTYEPDDGTFYREENEMHRNYSLHYEVLVSVMDFLKQAAAPVTIS